MNDSSRGNKNDRIELIDALRGYALMGLFLVHMMEYFELYWFPPPAKTEAVTSLVFALFGGKAYAMFAMLFGVSFYIILQRNANRGTDFRARFLWRVIILLLIGYLHGLMYSGDVLQILAVAGMVLLPLWVVPQSIVWAISGLLLLQITSYAFVAWMGNSDIPYSHPFFDQIQTIVYPNYAHGSFAQVLAANAVGGTEGKWSFMLESGRFATVLGMSMLGFCLARINFFTDTARFGKRYLPLLVMVIAAALVCAFSSHVFISIAHPEKMDDAWMGIPEMYTNTLFALASVLAFMLLYQIEAIRKVLRLLAAPGRMTLSFYVGQSLLLVPFFYHFGGNAYTWIGQSWSLTLGIVLWILQVMLAQWWAKRYYYGPLEWCWRAATYGTTTIPFKK